jgi:hypothetical protein
VQDFEGVAVENGDDGAGEVRSERDTCSEHGTKDFGRSVQRWYS